MFILLITYFGFVLFEVIVNYIVNLVKFIINYNLGGIEMIEIIRNIILGVSSF